MRNRLILIFALSLCFLQGFSQKSYFGGGVVFGNTFSAMSADNISGYWKTGITAGLFGNVKLVDNYNVRMLLQLDMNFTMKGTRSKPNFGVKGLAPPNKKSPPESSRNTTTPRSILCTRSNFDSVLHRAREHGGGGDVETCHGASLQRTKNGIIAF